MFRGIHFRFWSRAWQLIVPQALGFLELAASSALGPPFQFS
jgi:hypothetical protein